MAASDIDFAFVGRIVDEAQSCLRPIKESEILPAEAYVSEESWKFEKRVMLAPVDEGVLTLPDIARTCAEQPAAGCGLYPRKGALAPGSDTRLRR